MSWLNFIQREDRSFPDYKQPCWYFDAGVGWKIPLGNKGNFFSAGITPKQLKGERIGYGPLVGGQFIQYPEKFENT